jgi:methylglyoxal synthase
MLVLETVDDGFRLGGIMDNKNSATLAEHKTVTTPKKKRRSSNTTVALIAHDAKKVDIVMFASEHSDSLKDCELVATGSTGAQITEKTGLEVKCMLAGPEGGDLQIGGLIASGEVDLVIFLRDPLFSQPHDPDISALLRVSDVHNIPLATNPASADMLLKGITSRDLQELRPVS